MEIVPVSKNNIHLLKAFIDNMGDASGSFRYYNSRTIESINNHLTTLLLIEKKQPVAYGHLDMENEIVWLGICVQPNSYRKGYGNIMMRELINFAKKSNVSKIYLTVDKDNNNAINLYEKFYFYKENEFGNSYKYSLDLSPGA